MMTMVFLLLLQLLLLLLTMTKKKKNIASIIEPNALSLFDDDVVVSPCLFVLFGCLLLGLCLCLLVCFRLYFCMIVCLLRCFVGFECYGTLTTGCCCTACFCKTLIFAGMNTLLLCCAHLAWMYACESFSYIESTGATDVLLFII